MKMAAAEALWNTSEDPAPFTVFAKIDAEKKKKIRLKFKSLIC